MDKIRFEIAKKIMVITYEWSEILILEMWRTKTFTKDIDPEKNNRNPSRNYREIKSDYQEE